MIFMTTRNINKKIFRRLINKRAYLEFLLFRDNCIIKSVVKRRK